MNDDSDNEIFDFRLPIQRDQDNRNDEELTQSSEAKDDYEERVNLLKKITDNQSNNENSMSEYDREDPADLADLNKKLKMQDQNRLDFKKKENKKQKKSFVSPNLLRVTLLTQIIVVNGYHQRCNSEQEKATTLSHFSYDQIVRMEHKIFKASNLNEKLLVLITNFKQIFKPKTSCMFQPREKAMYSLYPDEFITKFLAFISIFGLKGRIVFGLDFAFTGLEQKFRVKAFPKNLDKNTSGDKMEEESRIQPEVDSKSLMNAFLVNNKLSEFDEKWQPENLEQFIFDKKQKPESLNQFTFSREKKQDKPITEVFQANNQVNPKQTKSKAKKQSQANYELFEQNNCLWLEILDDQIWVPFDPIRDNIASCNIDIIKGKLHKTYSMYVFTVQEIQFKDPFIASLMEESRVFDYFLVDLSYKYLHQYKLPRIQLQLEAWFNAVLRDLKLTYNGPIGILHDSCRAGVKADRDSLFNSQSAFRPQVEKEYKYHSIYALESQMNQYQMLRPGSKSCDFKVKEESVFLKRDIIVLHSRDRWRERLLSVKEQCNPIKEVTGRFDKTKVLPLYAEWQCDPMRISLEENGGLLPQNSYGNFEIFVHPPPRGTILFKRLGIKRILQKSNIPFIEAVDGFDQKSGKMFAQKCGYLIFQKDLEEVQKLYQNNLVELKERAKQNKYKELQKLWSNLFKGILIKKQIQEAYKE